MSYERLTHVEHILKRPDTYVGSLPPESASYWIRDGERFKLCELSASPGLVKIFDEVLVNAIDQYSMHPKKVSKIEVVTGKDFVFVRNYGVSIPIKKHETEKGSDGKPIWIPELIFGHLLTSSNYNDEEQRVTGGRNGYGAKLANVFSSKFNIKISDGKKIYMQTWTDNMSKVEPPTIVTSTDKISPYVSITFYPDWKRFGGPGEFVKLVEKRAWDAAMWCSKAQVKFNNQILEVKSLEDYAQMHMGDVPIAKMHTENFDVVVAHSTSGAFQQCSWVNGIATTKGGSHVDKVVKALCDAIATDKRVTVKPAQIRAALFVFVRAVVVNPTFSSQTKAECTSKITDAIDLKPKFVKDVLASGVLDDLISKGSILVTKELKKTDGSKKSRITGIPKLDDANWAGTHRSHDCTLIITEGDSAKALAIAGLSVVGRNAFGVFPLRGKPRNVRDATVKQVTDNEEFSNLKKILGLQHGKVYGSLRDLRYGRLMIMTDADLDGSHIKGLVLNMFHVYWPKLIELGFVVSMVTPVIKAGRVWYFTEEEYRQSLQETSAGGPGASKFPSGTSVKYYKGLGTSTSAEAKEYFKQIERLTVAFGADPHMNESMTLAFSKAQADDRKGWLTNHMAAPPAGIPYGHIKSLPVTDFVHRDLANFSAEDIKRSIPHVVDGLKPSQRKVIYACLKKNLTTDMKVAQLAGYIAEQTAYHHGEASLQGTIVNLAQNFVGANNLNLLEPSGQFGTRLAGGKDAASSRYIFTRLSPMTRRIFDPADNSVLKYVMDDGQQVEPEFYAPIVPMILVNGAEGIGTGFSCYVPPYDIEIIKHNIQCALDQVPMAPMVPHFKGFKGKVTKTKDHTWVLEGVVVKEGSQLHVTELPPGQWIQDFKEHLDALVEKGTIQKFENHSTETTPDFRIWGAEGMKDVTRELGMTKTIHTSNMHLIGPNGAVKKYNSPEEILVDYLEVRLAMYKKRKAWQLKQLETEVNWLSEKSRFIRDVAVTPRLHVFNTPLEQIHTQLRREKYDETLWPKLMDIKTYQYTKEEVTKLEALCESKRGEHARLKATSVVQLWKNNLSEI
ncbi:putative DNA topoisomerase II [Yellowstone lake phycodnavirus 2]|uniref:DNA topoisomerase II n=1 Tax=Yellowstone lake phycodnavirus 2 TaxID=1586714 RepID=UPI0006EB8F48|nr:DNA topoisomerase II [Yellowstone lake phycodnavirus 2]BAT22473.1 putative DNA topoisomerase II [Yellowstone lake phycodnavirus 2]